jgi:hypothetical protein
LKKFLLLLFLPLISCNEGEKKVPEKNPDLIATPDSSGCGCVYQYLWMNATNYNSNATVCSRFELPTGFVQAKNSPNSFGEWLQGLPLLPEGTAVHLYNGELKGYQGAHAAVINLDVSDRDLQQGIYAVIRLRAEYLFFSKQFDQLIFDTADSLQLNYLQYLKGRRIIIQGDKISENYYGKKYSDPSDHDVFSLFMDDVFRYAETSVMSDKMKAIPSDSMQVGDIFIHNGNPGHAVIIVDIAVNEKTGEKLFMIAQSYRPAQQMHILKNDYNKNISPWYPMHTKSKLITPEYVFDWGELKRF